MAKPRGFSLEARESSENGVGLEARPLHPENTICHQL